MNIALVGYGTMGKIVEEVVSEENKCFVVGKDFSSLFDIKEHIDCIIDFSSPFLSGRLSLLFHLRRRKLR